ncbi:MAG: hypothetical protein H7Y31_07960 [Chitinophagaceae bacterium]|nr:hypothetical protein [Chitinophagaceae bacterium]
MRYVIILIFISFTAVNSAAQADSAVIPEVPLDLPTDNLSLEFSKRLDTTSRRFSNITVIDSRADTSRVGIYPFGLKSRPLQLVTEENLSLLLQRHLTESFVVDSGKHDLLIFIRKFWLTKFKRDARFVNEEEITLNDGLAKSEIQFKIDCYISDEDKWVPWMRIDTICYSSAKIKNAGDNKINSILDEVFEKIATTSLVIPNQRARLTYYQLTTNYGKDFSAPGFSRNPIRKGVFKTFEDFKNNKPAYADFKLREGKSGNYLEIKDAEGKAFYSNNIWGFCDGKIVYVSLVGNLFPVFRTGNGFYVYAPLMKEKRNPRLLNFAESPAFLYLPLDIYTASAFMAEVVIKTALKTMKGATIFSLDPQTGELY